MHFSLWIYNTPLFLCAVLYKDYLSIWRNYLKSRTEITLGEITRSYMVLQLDARYQWVVIPNAGSVLAGESLPQTITIPVSLESCDNILFESLSLFWHCTFFLNKKNNVNQFIVDNMFAPVQITPLNSWLSGVI